MRAKEDETMMRAEKMTAQCPVCGGPVHSPFNCPEVIRRAWLRLTGRL